jgi:Fic family protein
VNARAALGALDSTARQLPNPQLLRRPALLREAQSTSALEGTYAPLSEVFTAADDQPDNTSLREIFNYVAAEHAFTGQAEGRPLSLGVLRELQQILVRGTPSDTPQAGQVRDIQVTIGHRTGASIVDARFVPHPPGDELVARLRELVDWMRVDRSRSIDPVVAAAMAHYHFETLHPFNDGNGRIGRLLIVLQLLFRRRAQRADPDGVTVVRGSTQGLLRRAARGEHGLTLGRLGGLLRHRRRGIRDLDPGPSCRVLIATLAVSPSGR